MKPSMTVFGLQPLNKNISKFYIPHYAQVPNIYLNARLSPLPVSSVMYTRNAWEHVDFWNSDADILYAEDSLSFLDALHTSGNHYSYFDPFLKLYRVAHSDVSLKTLGNNKNDHHVLEILANFIRADLIWVSPILEERLKPAMKEMFSKKIREHVREKTVVLPYPGFYKATKDSSTKNLDLRIKSKKPLVFLWNHRLVENKNFKDFCWILSQFKKDYDIPFEILFVCAEPEESILKALPKDLHENSRYVGFVSDRDAYLKAISKSNITLATSKLESFGNAVFDSISNGILLLNQDCNDALVTLLNGTNSTWSKKQLPEAIHKAYTSKAFRKEIHQFNITGMESIPNAKQHYKILSQRIEELLDIKCKSAPSLKKSEIVKKGLKALEKSTLSKRDLYKALGWGVPKNPLNAHWAGYYYAFRREGVKTTTVNNELYFHMTANPVLETKPKSSNSNKSKLW
jgi:glycosyltransferase involved in cell wall biosynthesis